MQTGENLNPQERRIYAQEAVDLAERISKGEADSSLLQSLNKEVVRAVAEQMYALSEADLVSLEDSISLQPELIRDYYEQVIKNGGHTPSRDNFMVHNIAEHMKEFIATRASKIAEQEETPQKQKAVWRKDPKTGKYIKE